MASFLLALGRRVRLVRISQLAEISPLILAQQTGDMSLQQNRLALTRNQPPLSDALIAHRAQEALRLSAFVSLRRLTCDVHEGMLTLRGRLPNFYTKQIALSLMVDVEGVEEITDRVEVA